MVLDNHVNRLKKLRQTLTGLRRDKEQFRIRHIRKLLTHILGELLHCLVILLDCIPFIDGDNHTLAALMGDTCDLRILIGNSLRCINDEHCHIASLDR